eukprot:gb/GFBE01027555.1/.p3 GENE.gb/GFBE01027555.1/~~gb/GFBE01027555.1/.p3  ORF type:complete len:118 (-),score=34.45 gb/GFBE01027555.1/:141-494(-)
MRMGTCPVVAPTGGLKDTVEDGLNGIWTDAEMTVEAEVEEESVESISRALRRCAKLFVEEPSKVEDMKVAAMAAAAEFTWSNAALQYEAPGAMLHSSTRQFFRSSEPLTSWPGRRAP